MSQLERNKTCPLPRSFTENNGKHYSQQPRTRQVHPNTSADVLNQAFIYPNSNDYRRKRINYQFVAKPPAKRGNLDPSDSIFNQAFIDSRPVRVNSKPASDVLNQAFIYPSSNLQRERTRNQFAGTPNVRRENSNPSRNNANKPFSEPRRYREHSKPSSDVLNQAFLYPRSNEYRSARVDNQNVKRPLPPREAINANRRFSDQAGRDLRPLTRNYNMPTNIRNQASAYSNSKLRTDGYSEQFYQRPPAARARSGHAAPIPEQCVKCRRPTPHQNLAFRVECTPEISPLSTFSNAARTAHTARSSPNNEAPQWHRAMSSATNLVYSPKAPDKKKTHGMMPTRGNRSRSAPKCCQTSTSEARSTKFGFLSRQDAKADCLDDLKESFDEFQFELPEEFWADPGKRSLLRDFLNDLKRGKCSANPSLRFSKNLQSDSTDAGPTTKSPKSDKLQNVCKKADEERAKRKESLIKHLRSTLKDKIPQLKLVVKMLELIMSWKHLRPRGSHQRSLSDETTALSRDEFVDRVDEKPGWCYCNKIKQEGTPFQNFALKPEPR